MGMPGGIGRIGIGIGIGIGDGIIGIGPVGRCWATGACTL
jgi:hypothetical protein